VEIRDFFWFGLVPNQVLMCPLMMIVKLHHSVTTGTE
jgi:hypothetical protein